MSAPGPLLVPRRLLAGIVGFLVPWTYFVVRELGGFGDLVATGYPVLAAGSVALASALLVPYRTRAAMVGFLIASPIVAVAVIAGPRTSDPTPSPEDPVRIVAVNPRWDNWAAAAVIHDIEQPDGDVLVVSEMTEPIWHRLSERYPHAVRRSEPNAAYGEGVFSRFPLENQLPLPDGQSFRVDVLAPRPFTLFASHLDRPGLRLPYARGEVSFGEARRQAARLRYATGRATLPVVLAGDLNMSDRTRGYRRLADSFRDATRVGTPRSTFIGGHLWRLLALRIDHVFIPPSWCAEEFEQFPVTGSDHNGIAVTVGVCD